MNYELYQMRDTVTGLFTYPLLAFNNENEAKRYFEWAINNGQVPPMSKKDMELYKVGSTNPETGELKGIEKEFIARSADVLGKETE